MQFVGFFVNISIATIALMFKQISVVRALPQTALNFIALIIKCGGSWGILIFVLLSWKVLKDSYIKILKPIGKISYEVYLVHGGMLLLFEIGINEMVCVAAYIILSVIGSVILFNIDKKLSGYARKILRV